MKMQNIILKDDNKKQKINDLEKQKKDYFDKKMKELKEFVAFYKIKHVMNIKEFWNYIKIEQKLYLVKLVQISLKLIKEMKKIKSQF